MAQALVERGPPVDGDGCGSGVSGADGVDELWS